MSKLTLQALYNELKEVKAMVVALFGCIKNSYKQVETSYMLHEWLDEWLEVYKVPNLKPSSILQLRICINRHIKPHLSDKPLQEITAIDIQRAINCVKSSRMKKYTYDTLGAALEKAYKLEYITDNPFTKTENVRHKRRKGCALTREQHSQFLTLVKGNQLEKLYKFYLLTGCRKSEALSVRWSDVDWIAKRILIMGTKTDNAQRYIPLFPELETLLLSVPNTGCYIFEYTENLVKCNFRRMKQLHKLPYSIHSLRHTFATRCLESGISINTVQKWLGHSNASVTSDIYSHVQTEFEREEIARFKAIN